MATFRLISLRLLEKYEIDSQRFAQQAGIATIDVPSAKARLPCGLLDRAFAKAADLIADPAFALRSAECWHPSHLGTLGYAWLSSVSGELREIFRQKTGSCFKHLSVIKISGCHQFEGFTMVQLLLVALCAGKPTVWKDLQLHFLSLLCIALLLFASCGSTMAQSWNQIPNSGSVVSVTALPNGSLLGVGTDKLLWTRSTLNSEWVQVPNSGHVSSVAVMPDGSILGAGMNTALWTRATLTGDWKQVPNSGSVIGVAVMRDGTIIGVGTDKQLYTRSTLTSDWKQVANSGAVISVAVMGDGSIIGVGTDNYLWTRSTLTDTWNKVPNSNSVSAVTVLPNDSIIGVGMDKTLWSQSKLENFSKANANNSASTTKESDPPWVLRSAASV